MVDMGVGLFFSGFSGGLETLFRRLLYGFGSVRSLAVAKCEKIERGDVFGGVLRGKHSPIELAVDRLGKSVGLVAIEVHDVRKVATEGGIPGEIGDPGVFVVEVFEIRSPGFVPGPFAVEAGRSRADLVETDGLSEPLETDEKPVFAEHFFGGFPTGPFVGFGTPPVVQRRADYVNVFVTRPIVFERGAKRHVFGDRSVEFAMDERRRLRRYGVFSGQVEGVYRKDHLERRLRQRVETREFAHVFECPAEIRRMRRPRIPAAVHLVHRTEKHLHLELPRGSEKPGIRFVERSRGDLRGSQSERRNRDMVDAAGSKQGHRAAEIDIGAGAVIVVNESDGRNSRARVAGFDAEDFFGEVVFGTETRLHQVRKRGFGLH